MLHVPCWSPNSTYSAQWVVTNKRGGKFRLAVLVSVDCVFVQMMTFERSEHEQLKQTIWAGTMIGKANAEAVAKICDDGGGVASILDLCMQHACPDHIIKDFLSWYLS